MHKLLERQLKKFGIEGEPLPASWEAFVDAVGGMYEKADRERDLLERSLDLATQELLERNRELRGDIARREQTQRALTKERLVLRQMIERIPCGITLTHAGRLVFCNQAWAGWLGYDETDALNQKTLEQLVHEDDLALFPEQGDAASARGPAFAPIEIRFIARSGEIVTLEVTPIQHLEFEGRNALLVVSRDISKTKRLEVELRHAQKLEAVGQLASGIAHEINTPIQYVGDGCHFLRDSFTTLLRLVETYDAVTKSTDLSAQNLVRLHEAEEEADVRYLLDAVPQAFERTVDGIRRVANIVRALKEFSHPDRGGATSADLNRVVENTLSVARHEYKYVADVALDLGELPPVQCHVSELSQALLNLVVNAAHAISDRVGDSGERGLISIRTAAEPGQVRIEVTDTGGGIAKEIRDRIFEPFFTTKEVGRGTGQGLAIARSAIVDKHKGELTFGTQMGVGTTFTIVLPTDGAGSPASTDRPRTPSLVQSDVVAVGAQSAAPLCVANAARCGQPVPPTRYERVDPVA
jgi:PAS domain S-box-containing protein